MELWNDPLARAWMRAVAAGSGVALALAAAYQVVPLSRAVAWGGAAVFVVALGWRKRAARSSTAAMAERKSRGRAAGVDRGLLLLAVAGVADAVIFALFLFARTDEPVVSPWNAFGWEPFVLFGLSTAFLFAGSRLREGRAWVAFAAWHAFVAFGVSALVYAVGFGFDPFLHRAAEEELAARGSIEPRQLLYAGQYVVVAAINLVTGVSVRVIDTWLVPALASFLVPIGAYLGLRYGWNLADRDARSLWVLALAQPFMLLTFTVPFTWTYAWYLALLFLAPVAARSWRAAGTLALGSVAMAAFHPLLAVPSFALVAGFTAWGWARGSRAREAIALVGLAVATATAVPALFVAYQWKQGVRVDVSALWERFDRFTTLFQSPFWDPYPYIPLWLDLVYDLRYWIPMVGMAAGLALLAALGVRRFPPARPYLAFALGLLAAILATSTLFSFRDIIDHEQLEFSLRLLTAWYLIPLPAFAYVISRAWKWKPAVGVALAAAACALAVHAWFFSYPQFNLKYPYFSPSVSAVDVEAVHAIHDHAAGASYLALSNQMTSAAAIQEFHFASYIRIDGEETLWYAIPTGGPLYAYYSRAVYSGPTRALFDELHARTGVATIYFIIHDYWPWYPGFVEELERGADSVLPIQGGAIRVYVYSYGNATAGTAAADDDGNGSDDGF